MSFGTRPTSEQPKQQSTAGEALSGRHTMSAAREAATLLKEQAQQHQESEEASHAQKEASKAHPSDPPVTEDESLAVAAYKKPEERAEHFLGQWCSGELGIPEKLTLKGSPLLTSELTSWFRNLCSCSGSGFRKKLDEAVQSGKIWKPEIGGANIYIVRREGDAGRSILFTRSF